jgi:hypothetical protein
MSTPSRFEALHHQARRMGGRDTREEHRAATPLELMLG